MSEEQFRKIAALERAIKEKYGSVSVLTPEKTWSEEKEKQFKQKVEEVFKKLKPRDVEVSYSKLQTCHLCNKVSLSNVDDVYLTKYDMCHNCFVKTMEN